LNLEFVSDFDIRISDLLTIKRGESVVYFDKSFLD